MLEMQLISGEESSKTFTDNDSNSSKYLNQQKEDGSHSDDENYDSDASSLNESSSEEVLLSDDEDDDDNYDYGDKRTHPSSRWVHCELSNKPDRTLKDLLEKVNPGPIMRKEDKRYYAYIYGYYRRSKGYGGYAIVFWDTFGKPVSGYYGVSKGRSYLYYLHLAMKRGLEIAAAARDFGKVRFSINSTTAAHHFNYLFKHPHLLTSYFHSEQDVADVNFCRTCLRNDMSLTTESFEVVVPIIKELIKLQLNIKFKYRERCNKYHEYDGSAYYLAKYGAEAFEEKMKQEGGVSSDGVEEVELKMEEIEDIIYIK